VVPRSLPLSLPLKVTKLMTPPRILAEKKKILPQEELNH
jgi:hypothetical protein